MEDSIYTKIIKSELPSHKIYEDNRVIAFLDINPINEGHTLVVPKQQIAHLWDLPDDDYAYLMLKAKAIANHIREILNAPRIGILVDGYGMPSHAHVHLLPLYRGLEHTISQHIARGPAEPDHAKLAEIAKKLAL